MANYASIPFIHSLGKFVLFYIDPASFLVFISNNGISATSAEDEEKNPNPPAEDFPMPDGDEINPTKVIPEEEEYLPDEQEVPVQEPPKEIEEDPYFPRKGDGLPPEKEDEFPKTDPV
ncbi:hypothetical protein [Algoriphagus aquimarinus]|uniref:Uncharacterized protein n=1 Tax=Algoriphagus aquimarinus TaxID=237018 RepID=A0A1I0Y061_9BACT|nr:hypothetical protein [Algoriphagus aquimarinus]SFB06524.1 hypothetical protein SAMN04489723_10438 [Algoriphagus aquimarinus]